MKKNKVIKLSDDIVVGHAGYKGMEYILSKLVSKINDFMEHEYDEIWGETYKKYKLNPKGRHSVSLSKKELEIIPDDQLSVHVQKALEKRVLDLRRKVSKKK